MNKWVLSRFLNVSNDEAVWMSGSKLFALELSLPGAKVPGNESSRELKFLELSLLGAKVPGNESSRERKFLELSLPGAKVPGSESSCYLIFWTNKYLKKYTIRM